MKLLDIWARRHSLPKYTAGKRPPDWLLSLIVLTELRYESFTPNHIRVPKDKENFNEPMQLGIHALAFAVLQSLPQVFPTILAFEVLLKRFANNELGEYEIAFEIYIVEYFDPYGVYQLLSPGLLPRLPLRNLHWESHVGPLRSISSLHIDLVPSPDGTQPLSSIESSFGATPDLSRVKSQDSTTSGDDGSRTQSLGQAAVERPASQTGTPKAIKERRHQIPGLRQTPYLKVFLLRCDDNDTYKAQARKEVREWIKEHTLPAQSTTKLNSQENHDAYEWLIIHVIVPNTAAATQPRTSGKSSENIFGSSATEKGAPRWRGGGSSTILEKLRADFNGSSKSAVDRIAQIRIGINDVPYEMLPRVIPAIPGSYSETPQENETAWLDLISKFKSLILDSFDMRVSQYEEDIREKDSQRSLPGWNFCTFFVLKEGLARGFESVGLVEDALVGYDELAVGLDTIVREQSNASPSAGHGGSFLPFTIDLKNQYERNQALILRDMGTESLSEETDGPIDFQSTGGHTDNEDVEIPLNATRKRYRELILSNDVSIFDFRCYLFSRQLSLLLRLANAWSSQTELLAKLKEQRESSLQGVAARSPTTFPSEDIENLAVLGEICKRSITFLVFIAQIMRDDIWASRIHIGKTESSEVEANLKSKSDPVMEQAVDNMVFSFTFALAQQILAQTSTKSLPIPPSTLAPPSGKLGPDGQEPKAAIPEPKTMMHPARSSSLAIRSRSREPPSPGIFPRVRRSSLPDQAPVSSTFLKIGLEDLAAYRAELYLLSRSVLERVGKERGWSVGWAEVARLQQSKDGMENIDLNETVSDSEDKSVNPIAVPSTLHGIDCRLLRTALNNKDDFYRLYETLTDKALRHYTVANRMQSVQTAMADLAILKYHLKDYAAAASYFYRMTPFYAEGGWSQIELTMLVMYSKCLKELKRQDEYLRVVLKLLSKAAMAERERLLRRSTLKFSRVGSLTMERTFPVDSYLGELLEITKTLQHEISVPLQSFFGHVIVDGTPRYHPEMDSFAIQLELQYLLPDNLNVERGKVKAVSISGDNHREIWLETKGPILFQNGVVRLQVQSNIIIPGTYVVNHVVLQVANMILEYVHESTGLAFSKRKSFFRCPKLLIYHRTEAFDVRSSASRYMHLDRNRSLEIELSSGWNDVTSGELHIRAATAGLRLQTSEAKIVEGSVVLSRKSEAGVIRFGAMESDSKAKFRMPFNLEHEVNDISLRLEISYMTEKGNFVFATTTTMSIMLPLGVNVQDVFKHNALFSKFTISSATINPLRLLSSKLENSEVFQAQCGVSLQNPVVIFPRQPASILYKITKSDSATPQVGLDSSKESRAASLSLVLHYICLEDEIDSAITESLYVMFKDSSLYPYIRLMISIVLTEFRGRLTPYDLERTAILSEVSTSILSDVRWRECFSGLGHSSDDNEDIADLLAKQLQEWQHQMPCIPLIPVTTDAIVTSRSIVIPVDIPSVTIVHTADLKLLERSSVPASTDLVASNQPISATLTIKWTRKWGAVFGAPNIPSGPNVGGQTEDLEFVYEVSGAPDTWLIGGKRKGHFKVPVAANELNEKLSFPVILIPLRHGFLPYPNVEIKPIHPGGVGVEAASQAKQTHITCETDYRNCAETIRVISDARKTTVSLDSSGPQGGAWLLESERRAAGGGGVVIC
ncbi:hypothetical protein B7494_g2133 [Chlorociboria aeruginascens]|nr:hypothetical protein B7494_g2133 [Chlorociboria aeruginascens]